jgi:ribonuclease P protein component
LRKNEILRGHQAFSAVLSKGKAFQSGVIRCFLLLSDEDKKGIKVGFSVSRTVRRSSLRNRLRRLMREAYRINKAILVARTRPPGKSVQAVFMCTPGTAVQVKTLAYGAVERAMIELLTNLQEEL